MPTVLRVSGYRLFFYSLENQEPAHGHVEHGEKLAKFWLSTVALAMNDGFRPHELTKRVSLVSKHRAALQAAWNVHLGSRA